ncbi:MAG: N-acetylglucosamine-6-phosphate deacetylase, partial [Aeromonadaceae bacterium]
AKMLGIADRLGSLAVGKKANLLALTTELNQQHIWVAGRKINPTNLSSHFSGSRVNQDAQESLCI